MDAYGVVGNPINHSKSPKIHHLFAEQLGHQISYSKIESSLEDFTQTIELFFTKGGKGLNITLPFKEAAFKLSDSYGQSAENCQAVNTLSFSEDGRIYGESTDGLGLLKDLENNDIYLEGKEVLLLGSGGAARSVIPSLHQKDIAGLTVCNRTKEKAIKIREDFIHLREINVLDGLNLKNHYDIVINATSANLNNEAPEINPNVFDGSVCYDMGYTYGDTFFLNWAKKFNPSICLQGWGMLVEQAAESFYIWRGVRPDTEEIILRLQKETEN